MNRFICAGLIASLGLLCPNHARGATLAGQTLRPGGTLDIHFPIDKYFQNYAVSGGNPRPTSGRALISFPKGFDSARRWPILVVTSTANGGRTSPMDAPLYQEPAMAEGWIVLATDATIRPRDDSATWRLAALGGALVYLHKQWPQSKQWPIAFAGFSGGAKSSEVIGPILASTGGIKVCGFLLIGVNEDRLGQAYKIYHPPSDFLNVPIWLSSGNGDSIAPPWKVEHVRASLVNTGFKRVRVESFDGGHEVDPAQVQLALRWFRQLGNF